MSFLHIPLNFGAVMKRSMATIEAAGAAPDEMVVLSDENSLWGADVYIAISKDIPGARTTTLSGTFLTKVFEGPYRNMRNWIEEMKSFVKGKGKALPETVLLLHDLSEVREEVRQELRRHPGSRLSAAACSSTVAQP